jgi:classical protein kinase C
MKVEDVFKGRTKPTKTERWADEVHEFEIDKANEVELTVYDRTGDNSMPIGMLWIRITDIVEELRRKRIEAELNTTGWVSADKMQDGGIRPDLQFQPPPGHSGQGFVGGGPSQRAPGGGLAPSHAQTGPVFINAWFALEPVGRINLTLNFGMSGLDVFQHAAKLTCSSQAQ